MFETGILTAIGGIVGSIATYFVTRSNNGTKLKLHNREQLSKDTYQFIAELKEMVEGQREEIEALRKEIKELQQVNVQLTVDNKELQIKIAELNERLAEMNQ